MIASIASRALGNCFTRCPKSFDQSEPRQCPPLQKFRTQHGTAVEIHILPSYIMGTILRSTYKPAVSHPSTTESPLPPGWSEHKAPTGHSYYYNAETKQSTYTRPITTVETALHIDFNATTPSFGGSPAPPSFGWHDGQSFSGRNRDTVSGNFRGGRSYQDRSRRQHSEDRPKSKIAIPDCEPWVLVKTRLGRRFVYNPEQDESFWKFPPDVLLAVLEMDRREREKREVEETPSAEMPQPDSKTKSSPAIGPLPEERPLRENGHPPLLGDEDDDSYEEVEVTDDEDDDAEAPLKKQKLDDEQTQGPVEFNEDDIAYQLGQMGEGYGLDSAEYGGDGEYYNEEYEEGAEGLPLTEEDSTALFRDLLDDFRINPYTTWEKIIEEGRIIEDDRYTVLPNMGLRRQVFSDWSRDRIHELQEKRQKEGKKDPRIAYLRFLHEHATPKLYWLEFKRKFKKEPEMKDLKLTDKDREKMYRDHISRLKLPESTRRAELEELLKEMPLSALNHDSTLNTLPSTLLTNLKYISLPVQVRDAMVEEHISTLPAAPEVSTEDLSVEELAELGKKKDERRKREAALAERERQVQEAKRKQRGVLRHGRELQEEEAAQLERARRVGKEGLMGYLESENHEAAETG